MGRSGRWACVFALSSVACAAPVARVTHRLDRAQCHGEPPAGIDPLLQPRATIVLGDLPGTREVPEVVGHIVCRTATPGTRVRLVLEIPTSEAQRVGRFVHSRGDHDDRVELVRSAFWLGTRQVSASVAMVALLERVRTWTAAGADIEVVAADDWVRTRGDDRATVALLDPRRPLAATAVTLRVVAGGGTRWRCPDGQSCGPRPVPGAGDGFEPRVRWDGVPRGWDGVLWMGVVSASPPAVEPAVADLGADFDSARGM